MLTIMILSAGSGFTAVLASKHRSEGPAWRSSNKTLEHRSGPPSGAARCLGRRINTSIVDDDGVPVPQNTLEACLELRICKGQDVSQLSAGVHLDQLHLLVLDHLVREVLADVYVLGALSSANHVVSPLNACRVVLVHRVGLLGESHVG